MIPKFDGIVDKGRLKLWQEDDFKNYMKSFEGKNIELILRRQTHERTNQQNRYLWGVIYKMISDYTGMNQEDVHDFCKLKFNQKFIQVESKTTGEVLEEFIGGSTAKMTTEDFSNYTDSIRNWAASFLSLQIPDPGQVVIQEEPENV